MAKGSQFERDTCRRLSTWWSGDPDTDVLFWRTSQSGGRATSRGKRGKHTTASHCGDIAALDERGAPLTRLITFELKRGYQSATIHELLDKPQLAAVQTYEKWIEQAITAASNAKTPFWALIHARNRRDTTLTIPSSLFEQLGCTTQIVRPPTVRLLAPVKLLWDVVWIGVTCMKLESFLDGITPSEIRHMLDQPSRAAQ